MTSSLTEPAPAPGADPAAPDPDWALGPGSVSWEVMRNPCVYVVGILREAILLTLHLPFAAAATDHDRVHEDPALRFRTVARYVYSSTYGTKDNAELVAGFVRRRHTEVTGVEPVTGRPYRANSDYELALTHVLLSSSFLAVYEELNGPLPIAERDQYVLESKSYGALLGIDPEYLPSTSDGLEEFLAEARTKWATGFQARAILKPFVSGEYPEGSVIANLPARQRRLASVAAKTLTDMALMTMAPTTGCSSPWTAQRCCARARRCAGRCDCWARISAARRGAPCSTASSSPTWRRSCSAHVKPSTRQAATPPPPRGSCRATPRPSRSRSCRTTWPTCRDLGVRGDAGPRRARDGLRRLHGDHDRRHRGAARLVGVQRPQARARLPADHARRVHLRLQRGVARQRRARLVAADQDLGFFDAMGRTVPIFVPIGYAWFCGGLLYFTARFYERGVTARQVWGILGLVVVVDFIGIGLPTWLGLLGFFGDPPMNIFGYPLWWAAIDGVDVILGGAVVYFLLPVLKGRQQLWLVLVPPVMIGLSAGAVGWPVSTAINSGWSTGAKWAAATVTIGLGLAITHLVAKVVSRVPPATPPEDRFFAAVSPPARDRELTPL